MFKMRVSVVRLVGNQGDRRKDAETVIKYRADLLANIEEFERLLKLNSSDEEIRASKRIRENFVAIIPLQDQFINRTSPNEAEAFSSISRHADALINDIGEIMVFENKLSETRASQITEEVEKDEKTLIISMLAAIALSVGVAVVVTRSITRPVKGMVETVEAMAGGDLSRTIVADSKDEIGILQSALGRMNGNLARMIGDVREGSNQLVTSASELSSAANDVRHSSELQSEQATAMAAALEQMTTSINHVSTLSDDARQTSSNAGKIAHSGSKTIRSMVDEIRQMAEAVTEGATKAQQLGQESERISTIIHVIRDVADQTNLLALNAAIEAARAGEQGRGFAVVADEVRKLAEKTTTSAQEITGMVSSIQGGASAMSDQMETTSKRMQEGMGMAQKAGSTVGEIDTGAQNVVRMIDDVARALKEQAAATQDIAGRVEQIVQMVEENSSAVGSVANSAEGLNALATMLRGSVERFRVPG
ncbi:MAG: methyl-accepting chemotaxis protein [Betaproteobacteria bacterium]|nr:methyl-accepting chemotaxis protein [Betaproteobacteria bacterium]